jgi:AcrR family transcriptional regulator
VYTGVYTLGVVASNPSRVLLDRPARREAILTAAATAFAQRGFAATSMDDVAGEAGITRLILYRHFDSKEDLYSAVLMRVSDRFIEEFAVGVEERRALSAIRALLVVARENPAAVVLLWRHAAREPQFAAYAEAFRDRTVAFAHELLSVPGLNGRLRSRWAAETMVSFVFDALLHWLEEGAPGRDEEFLALMAASIPALVNAWGGVEP